MIHVIVLLAALVLMPSFAQAESIPEAVRRIDAKLQELERAGVGKPGPVGPRGAKGARGPTGPRGPKGADATLAGGSQDDQGYIVLKGKNGKLAVKLSTDSDGGVVRVYDKNEKTVVASAASEAGDALVWLNGSNGKRGLMLSTDSDGGSVSVSDKNEKTVVLLAADNDGAGVVRVNGKQVHDYAEIFDISSRQGLKPGSVVAYDPGTDGMVAASAGNARQVIGVISGAGGFRPGMVIGSRADGSRDLPVAMSGVIYVRVSGEAGAVQAGDLLVPSSAAGVGMRAADSVAAAGKVFGKALQPWSGAGEGLVRMLVLNR